jgi:hypothetical protein
VTDLSSSSNNVVVEEEIVEGSNSSGIDNSFSTHSMSRQDSLKSLPSVIQPNNKRYGIQQNYSNIPISLQLSSSNEEEQNIKSVAFISELSKQFVYNVKELCKSRDIFCTTEYPNSFSGEEAVVKYRKKRLCLCLFVFVLK